jgi:hypothetical protein
MIIDIHVHTEATPGGLPLIEVAKAAKAAGLDAIVVTDTARAADPVVLERVAKEAGISVFAGVELPMDRGKILAIPPELGASYGPAAWGAPDEDGFWDWEDTHSRLLDAGYALVAVQPFDRGTASGIGENIYQLAGVHAVEVAVPRCSPLAHDQALEAALSLHLAAVAGSNTLSELGSLGAVATLFAASVNNQADLARELRAGDVWVIQLGGGLKLQAETERPFERRGGDRGGDRDRDRGRDRDRDRGRPRRR